MRKLICLIRGHVFVSGHFSDGMTFTKTKCKRCNARFGVPSMEDEYIRKIFPVPPKTIKN